MTLWSQESYLAAWRFAATAHGQQKLPGTDLPYNVHVGAVAMELMAACAVEPVAMPDLAIQCALLHDTLEDTATHPDELAARFGPAVLAGVQALSKNPALHKSTAMQDSLARIRLQPREVWMVKLADRISNLGDPPDHWSADKVERYRREAMDILAALGEASPFLAARLAQRIRDYARSAASVREPRNRLWRAVSLVLASGISRHRTDGRRTAPSKEPSAIMNRQPLWLNRRFVAGYLTTVLEELGGWLFGRLTRDQKALREGIATAVGTFGGREIVFRSEWGGYLPFGCDWRLEHTSEQGVTRDIDVPCSERDLAALERSGFLEKIAERRNPDDAFDCSLTYRVRPGRAP